MATTPHSPWKCKPQYTTQSALVHYPAALCCCCCYLLLQIRMDLKHLKTKNQKAAAKHKSETDALQVRLLRCAAAPLSLSPCDKTDNETVRPVSLP